MAKRKEKEEKKRNSKGRMIFHLSKATSPQHLNRLKILLLDPRCAQLLHHRLDWKRKKERKKRKLDSKKPKKRKRNTKKKNPDIAWQMIPCMNPLLAWWPCNHRTMQWGNQAGHPLKGSATRHSKAEPTPTDVPALTHPSCNWQGFEVFLGSLGSSSLKTNWITGKWQD